MRKGEPQQCHTDVIAGKTRQSDETWRKQSERANRPNQMFLGEQQTADAGKL